jgi:hypothetical protein
VSSDIKELVGLTAWIRTAYSTSFGLVVVFCMSRPASGLSVIIPLCVKTGIATVLIVGENMEDENKIYKAHIGRSVIIGRVSRREKDTLM